MFCPGFGRVVELYAIGFEDSAALDHDNRIRACWNGRPCHDLGRLTGFECASRRLTRHDLIDHGESRAGLSEILGAHRVAIHQGLVIRRHVQIAGDVLSQDQIESRSVQRHHARRQGPSLLGDQSLSFGDT